MPKYWLLWYALIFSVAAQAETTPLPTEFWDYFIEYGDQQGDLFDPLDLAEADQVEQHKESLRSQSGEANRDDNEEQKR